MVSYYNSLAMFPQPSRPGAGPPPGAASSSLYSSYSHYPQYSAGVAGHDQNSNLQLYAGFSPEFSAPGHTPVSWPHSWPAQFPGSCRSSYDWPGSEAAPAHPPPTTTPTSASEPGLHSPNSPQPQFSSSGARTEAGAGSPSPSDYSVPVSALPQYKASLSPAPLLQHYKTEPSSSTELGLPTSPGPGVVSGPPNISIGSSLDEDCPSPSPLSRPQPARSPFEWMKKPSHSSPPASSDPNARTRTKDKYRIVYSDHQRLELEKEFHYSRYITIRRKAELANMIGLSERQVKIWFQNRRAKERRSLKKSDDPSMKDKLDTSVGSLGAFSPPMMGEFPPCSLGMPLGPHGLPQHHFHQMPGGFPPIMKFE